MLYRMRSGRLLAAFLLAAGLIAGAVLVGAGCAGSPDASAPERTVIDRTSDWHGALLYVADEEGPTAGWGSVRVYDNVSGFVEKSVEQTAAAQPSDMWISPDESTMYAAGSANGRIARFRYDGNNWNPDPGAIDTPSDSLLALDKGPDNQLYAADGAPDDGMARLLVVDPNLGTLTGSRVTFPTYTAAHGAAWSPNGSRLYVPVSGPGKNDLLICEWPSGRQLSAVNLPGPPNQAVVSPDGKFVYVFARGEIYRVDAATGALAPGFQPSGETSTEYFSGDFSADGRYLFATGTPPGSDSTLYVIDVMSGSAVSSVRHISVKAAGLKRVE